MFECRWEFPDPSRADQDGYLAAGGDMSVETLLYAYSRGIFPWTSDPITWWSPDPRAIFEIDRFHVPRRLERMMKQKVFDVTFDKAFPRVMEECARPMPGREKTWISKAFIEAYTRLHKRGYAHSVECWKAGSLVGGVYGVSIGGFFAGESMFHTESNASKVALASLMRRLLEKGFTLFDTQVPNPHLERLGISMIPRNEYLQRLETAISLPVGFS